jgi:hypothetical protein
VDDAGKSISIVGEDRLMVLWFVGRDVLWTLDCVSDKLVVNYFES